jgi:hypothetical protein
MTSIEREGRHTVFQLHGTSHRYRPVIPVGPQFASADALLTVQIKGQPISENMLLAPTNAGYFFEATRKC